MVSDPSMFVSNVFQVPVLNHNAPTPEPCDREERNQQAGKDVGNTVSLRTVRWRTISNRGHCCLCRGIIMPQTDQAARAASLEKKLSTRTPADGLNADLLGDLCWCHEPPLDNGIFAYTLGQATPVILAGCCKSPV